MRKPAIILLVTVFALWMLASAVKGSIANAERAEMIRQCEANPSCTYVHIQK